MDSSIDEETSTACGLNFVKISSILFSETPPAIIERCKSEIGIKSQLKVFPVPPNSSCEKCQTNNYRIYNFQYLKNQILHLF